MAMMDNVMIAITRELRILQLVVKPVQIGQLKTVTVFAQVVLRVHLQTLIMSALNAILQPAFRQQKKSAIGVSTAFLKTDIVPYRDFGRDIA